MKEAFFLPFLLLKIEEGDEIKNLISLKHLLTTAIVMSCDIATRDFVLSNQSKITKDILRIFNEFGDGKYLLLTLFFSFCLSLYKKDKELEKNCKIFFKRFVKDSIRCNLLKVSFARSRPLTGKNIWFEHKKALVSEDFRSFPSGHATVSKIHADFLSSVLKDYKFLFKLSHILCCFARVYSDSHWLSDVFYPNVAFK